MGVFDRIINKFGINLEYKDNLIDPTNGRVECVGTNNFADVLKVVREFTDEEKATLKGLILDHGDQPFEYIDNIPQQINGLSDFKMLIQKDCIVKILNQPTLTYRIRPIFVEALRKINEA